MITSNISSIGSYPKILKYKRTGEVVLFSKEGCGINLNTLEYREDWLEYGNFSKDWELYDKEVVLSNV